MNKFFKYTGITILSLVLIIYVLFLIIPFFINGIVNSYSPQISKAVEDSSGFKLKLDDIRLLTTPKLTVGLGISHIDVSLPNGESFLTADNVQGKLSLLPLLLKKIEIDMVGADNINANLKVKKDGKFLLEDYLPAENKDDGYRFRIFDSLLESMRSFALTFNSNINYEHVWKAREGYADRHGVVIGESIAYALSNASNLPNFAGILDYTTAYYDLLAIDIGHLERIKK